MNSIVTIVTGAASTDLTTVAAVKDELGITGTSEDEKILTWIRQASSMIAGYCNRVFAEETLSEQFRLTREEAVLQLRRWPVSSITSITQDEDDPLDGDTDYEFDPDTGQVWRLISDIRVSWAAQKIVVVYVAGYELLGELPYEIERAAISLVKLYRSSATRDPMLKSESIPDVWEGTYWVGAPPGGGLPPEVTVLIDPYREIVF